MKKLFDVMAVICGILFLIFAMALDSPGYLPVKICAVCAAYLAIYAYISIKNGNCIDLGDDE